MSCYECALYTIDQITFVARLGKTCLYIGGLKSIIESNLSRHLLNTILASTRRY